MLPIISFSKPVAQGRQYWWIGSWFSEQTQPVVVNVVFGPQSGVQVPEPGEDVSLIGQSVHVLLLFVGLWLPRGQGVHEVFCGSWPVLQRHDDAFGCDEAFNPHGMQLCDPAGE